MMSEARVEMHWRGSENPDDKSGTLFLSTVEGSLSVKLESFSDARRIDRLLKLLYKRGKKNGLEESIAFLKRALDSY